MNLVNLKSFLAFCVSLLLLPCLACHSNTTVDNVKFDKAKWDSVGDLMSFPLREAMLNDLITHHQIKGLTYRRLIDWLGEPANYTDMDDSIRYDIVVNYGYLDPKSGTYLAIGFNKDSIATGFKVVHWQNRHANE